MIRYNFLLLIIFAILFTSVKAEVIKGRPNFCFKPNGQVFVTLKEGTRVECGPLENGWFKISITVKITKQQYDGVMKKGAKLYANHSEFVGVALTDVPVESSMPSSYGGANGLGAYEMEIFGYVPQANIRENSIPENALQSLLKNKADHLQYDSLKSFLAKQRYVKMDLINKTLPQLTEFCIYESTVVDQSPGYRIGLIFEGSKLIAIEHSRPFNLLKGKEYYILERNKLYVITPPKGLSVNAFVTKINKANEGAD